MGTNTMSMYKALHKEGSSKCFVLVFAAFVILCALVLVFAAIVLRVRRPVVELESATVNHISYSTSPLPSFNVILIAHLTIDNPNFGSVDHENSTVSVLYGVTTVGDRELVGGRVKARETKGMNVTVNLRSNKLLYTGNLTNDILSGTLKLTTYAKVTGTVHLLKIVNKKKTAQMSCTMNLNLTSHSIHNLHC